MTKYQEIDVILNEWARAHSLRWLTKYQDDEVRSFFLRPEILEKIQVWVDPPVDGRTKIHIFQYRVGGKKKNGEALLCNVSELSAALDKALEIANGWLIKTTAQNHS